jgi:hypothetical protein
MRQKDDSTCELVPNSGQLRRVINSSYIRVTLDSAPERVTLVGYPVLAFR